MTTLSPKSLMVLKVRMEHDHFLENFIIILIAFEIFVYWFVCIFVQQREEAYQRELEAARIEKEKEIARLRAQQERAKDKQAEKVRWE